MSYQQIAPRTTRETLDFVRHELAMEARHDVGAAGEPAFKNNWANFGGGYETAGFYMTPFGEVVVYGMVANAVNAGAGGGVIFTLPAGYAPRAVEQFWAYSNTAGLAVITQVNPNGDVIRALGGAVAEAAYRLFGIRFRVADR
jgi:hypothetical protein